MPEDTDYRYRSNRAMMLLYFPAGSDGSGIPDAIWECSGARRQDGFDVLRLYANEMEQPFEAYLSFIGADRQVSNSVWVGF